MHPKIGFLDMIAPADLPADFVWDIERWKTRSGVVKINVAMSELPDFTAMPGKELQEHHTGSVELCFCPPTPSARSRTRTWTGRRRSPRSSTG